MFIVTDVIEKYNTAKGGVGVEKYIIARGGHWTLDEARKDNLVRTETAKVLQNPFSFSNCQLSKMHSQIS